MAVTPEHPPTRVPRASLAVLPTPLQDAPRLADALGIRGRLLVKRDDLTGFAAAGNKARPLEVLVAEACATGADMLVTGGAPGSNFCQAAAAAAAWADLGCVLVYAGSPAPTAHPNLAAGTHWGAQLRWTHDPDRASVDTSLDTVADELRAAGHAPFVVPRGGATPLGATGFHLAALELRAQLPGPAVVVVATGSGGTSAGLVSGAVATGREIQVRGAAVSRPPEETAGRVLDLATGCALLMGTEPPRPADVVVRDARGPGHGLPSVEGDRATMLALRASGLILDPVYSAKALGALPGILGASREDPELTTVFWHTGGLLDAVAGWER